MAAAALTTRTERIPMMKVQMEERRKHHHFLSTRHSSLSIRGMPWTQYASLHYTLYAMGATYIGGEGLNIVPHLHREGCLYTSLLYI